MTPDEARLLEWLVGHREEWIRRRTDSITFDGEYTLEREVLFEVLLPPEVAQALPDLDGRKPIPLTDLARVPALHVAVTKDGEPVPTLLRDEERQILTTALTDEMVGTPEMVAIAEQAGIEPDEVWNCFERIVRFELDPVRAPQPSPLDQEIQLKLAGSWPLWQLWLDTYYELRVVMAAPHIGVDERHFLMIETHSESLIGPSQATIMGALRAWRRRNNPETSVRAAWRLEPRDEDSWRERIGRSLVVADGSGMTPNNARFDLADRPYSRHWRAPIGVPDTFIVSIPIDSFLDCQSYHLQLRVPSGIYIDRALLRAWNEGPYGASEVIIVEEDDRHPDLAHLHFSRSLSARGALDDDYYPALLRVVLRPTLHSGLRAGLHISLVSTAALWALALTIGWREAGADCVLCVLRLGRRNTDSLVALLLLAPTAALVAIVRDGEPDIAKKVQSRYRARIYVTGLCLFSTSLSLALDVQGTPMAIILFGTAILSTLLFIRTAHSAIYSLIRIRRKSGRAPRFRRPQVQ